MRKLERPDIDDEAILDDVVGRQPLAGCPHLRSDKSTVLKLYGQYVAVAGNAAALGAPRPLVLPGMLQKALSNKYDSDASLYSYIDDIRNAQDVNACPMCGSPSLGSVDHIFPQERFPELAIYSPNLVPACSSCNSARRDRYLGALPGERVLHPYFDSHLDERLISAKIEPVQGNFRRPKITVNTLIHTMHPLFPAVRFHFREVILKTRMLQRMDTLWVDLQRKDDVYFQSLPSGNFTNQQFSAAVNKSLSLSDKEFSTPNNWKSFLLYGLAENLEAQADMANTIRDIRSGALDPADI